MFSSLLLDRPVPRTIVSPPGSVQPPGWDRARLSHSRTWEATVDLSFTQPLYTAAIISCLHQICHCDVIIRHHLYSLPVKMDSAPAWSWFCDADLVFYTQKSGSKGVKCIFFILWTDFSKRYLNLFLLVSSTNLMYKKMSGVNKIWVLLHQI